MITVRANARNAAYISDDLITSGSVGIPVTFVLSEDFDSLSAIAVFEGSGTARDVALIGNTCVVPHEVVATAGGYLRIGIYASNAEGTIVIPTVWAGCKMILQGTEPSEFDPSEPTPSWAAQVQEAAAEAVQTSEEAIEIAGGAEAAAEEARESASAAATSATDAGQFASAAGTAQTAAEAAQTAAASARDAAVAAQGRAESSAQTAAGSATAAAGSAAAAAASEAAAKAVEESIPADYTALSKDVVDLKSQMTELDDQINGTGTNIPTPIPISDFALDNWYIATATGTWVNQSNRGYYIEIPENCTKISMIGHVNATRPEHSYTECAYLVNIDFVAGQAAPIVGTTLPTRVEGGDVYMSDVPIGANYLYIRRLDGDGYNIEPTDITFYLYVRSKDNIVSKIDNLETDVSGLRVAIDDLDADIDQLKSDVESVSNAIPKSIVFQRKAINASGEITDSTTSLLSGLAEAVAGKTIHINDTSYRFRVAWYRSDGTFGGVSDWNTETYTQSIDHAVQVQVTRAAGTGTVTIDDAVGLITTDIPFPTEYVNMSGIVDLPSKEEFDNVQAIVNEIEPNMPVLYELTRQTINASGVITGSNQNLLSSLIYAKTGMSCSITSPYKFRIVYYSDEGVTVSSVTSWVNSYTIIKDAYIRVHIHNDSYPNDYIYPADVSNGELSTTIPIPRAYLPAASKESLNEYEKYEQYNLNMPFVGKEDMMWTWWSYPQIISFRRVRNKLYWTYTTHVGYSGVASYDFDTHEIVKNNLKKSDRPDDHNNMTVFVLSDGTILTAYTESHYSNHKMYIRRSSVPESVEAFDDAVEINTTDYVTYARIFEYNDTLWLFTRSYVKNWTYMTSTDGGLTWSAETKMITADMQYYCLVMPTTTDGILRLVMYSNPNESDPNIRLGFFHCSDGGIYNSDNTTLLGYASIPATSFSIIVPVESGKTQRLLDCAVTAPEITKVLYTPFTEQPDGTDEDDYIYDAVYKLYNNGTVVTICDAGYTTWKQRYQNGASFIDDANIVVGRSDGTYDYIETYALTGNTITFEEEIKKEALGTIPIRNARPIVDVNGKALMWWRGFYNHNSYQDFNTDAEIHELN